jgi:hypothetical protein
MTQIKHQPPQTRWHQHCRISFGHVNMIWQQSTVLSSEAHPCSDLQCAETVSKFTSPTKPFFCFPLKYSQQVKSAHRSSCSIPQAPCHSSIQLVLQSAISIVQTMTFPLGTMFIILSIMSIVQYASSYTYQHGSTTLQLSPGWATQCSKIHSKGPQVVESLIQNAQHKLSIQATLSFSCLHH